MTVSYQSATTSGLQNGNFAWDHDNVTPKGVLVYVNTDGSATTKPTAVSYGGVALAEVAFAADTGQELGNVSAWFRGDSLPSGVQSVSVTTAATDWAGLCYSFGGATDLTEYDASTGENQANPSVVPDCTPTFVSIPTAGMYTGLGVVETGVTPGSGYTRTGFIDLGQDGFFWEHYTTGTVTGDPTVNVTSGTDDVAFVAVTVGEVEATVVTGAAALAPDVSLAAVALNHVIAAASLAGLSNAQILALLVTASTGSLSGGASLSALGEVAKLGAANVTAGATASAVSQLINLAAASLTGGLSLEALATVINLASATLTPGATVTALGDIASGLQEGIAALLSSGAVSVSGKVYEVSAWSDYRAATTFQLVTAAALLQASSSLSVASLLQVPGTSNIQASGTTTVAALLEVLASLNMPLSASMLVIGDIVTSIVTGTANINAAGSVTAQSYVTVYSSVDMTLGGTVVPAGTPIVIASAAVASALTVLAGGSILDIAGSAFGVLLKLMVATGLVEVIHNAEAVILKLTDAAPTVEKVQDARALVEQLQEAEAGIEER